MKKKVKMTSQQVPGLKIRSFLHFRDLNIKAYSRNADERGLLWRVLLDRTMSFKDEKCHGGKKREKKSKKNE